MIEKMKSVCVVARANRKDELLTTLRSLGILHLSQKQPSSQNLLERFSTLSSLSVELQDYQDKNAKVPYPLTDDEFEKLYQDTLQALEQKAKLSSKQNELQLEIEKLRPWGDFNPQQIKDLSPKLDLHFYRLDKKQYHALKQNKDISFISLAPVAKMATIAVLGQLDNTIQATEFELPQKGISQLTQELNQCKDQLVACEDILKKAALHLNSYADQLTKAQNDAEYSAASNTLVSEDNLVWITGYIPATEEGAFSAAAKQHHWAWLMADASEDDAAVPTKIRYNKLTALVKPIFDILGTVPGYGEYDISFWFLAFFSLFFAMIIGDAGYGILFLLGTAAYHLKSKKTTNAMLLLYLLSGTTIVWGAVTGTWFGLESAMEVPLLKSMVIPPLANYPQYFGLQATATQNNVMRFCFSIGVIQLALACIMNIKRKTGRRDLSWVADLGWLLSICALYLMVLYLVIGQSIPLAAVGAAVGIGFLLVVLFGGMQPGKSFSQGLKAGLGSTFTVFLNTISAFGNIMS